MKVTLRVALHGFSDFEHRALGSLFRLAAPPALSVVRAQFEMALGRLPQTYKSLQRHTAFPVRLSRALQALQT